MPDRLIISDLAAECRLGVYEWEQAKPQPVWIDLELEIDAAQAARRDDVRDAVDYARLVTLVTTHLKQHTYALLETAADRLAALILQEFPVPKVVVRVKKRALPGVDYAAVEVERTRRGARAAGRRSRRGAVKREEGGVCE